MVIRKTIKKARAKLKYSMNILVWITRNAPQLFFPCKEFIGSEKIPVHFNDKTIMCLTCASLAYEERAIWIGNFRVPFCLCFRVSLSAKPFLWKWLWSAWKWNGMHNSFSYERFHTWIRSATETQEYLNGLLIDWLTNWLTNWWIGWLIDWLMEWLGPNGSVFVYLDLFRGKQLRLSTF